MKKTLCSYLFIILIFGSSTGCKSPEVVLPGEKEESNIPTSGGAPNAPQSPHVGTVAAPDA